MLGCLYSFIGFRHCGGSNPVDRRCKISRMRLSPGVGGFWWLDCVALLADVATRMRWIISRWFEHWGLSLALC